MSQENTLQLNPGDIVPDGDTGAVLVMLDVTLPEAPIRVAHGLGRTPTKAYVVEARKKFFHCYVAFKDRDQIHLVFNDAGGTALVRIT